MAARCPQRHLAGEEHTYMDRHLCKRSKQACLQIGV